jgi:hypothetical protein
MRRRDGGTDRGAPEMAVPIPVADAGQFPVFGRSGARGSCLASRLPGGVGAPPGTTTSPREELADESRRRASARGDPRPAPKSAARRRSENAAAERQEAQRPSVQGRAVPERAAAVPERAGSWWRRSALHPLTL